jgi:hypothetical protein
VGIAPARISTPEARRRRIIGTISRLLLGSSNSDFEPEEIAARGFFAASREGSALEADHCSAPATVAREEYGTHVPRLVAVRD